jgi:hypothetical protein
METVRLPGKESDELKGESTAAGIMVRVIQVAGPILAAGWIAWAFFGINPVTFFIIFVESRVGPQFDAAAYGLQL